MKRSSSGTLACNLGESYPVMRHSNRWNPIEFIRFAKHAITVKPIRTADTIAFVRQDRPCFTQTVNKQSAKLPKILGRALSQPQIGR
jgi:hypothetical protein